MGNKPKGTGKPDWDAWAELARVCMSVDAIIEDGYPPGGLLAPSWGLLDPSPSSEDGPMPSKLAGYLVRPNADYYTRITEALPGIENAGGNRAERLAVLMARLPELPAYAWLIKQPSYREDVRAKLKGGALAASYQTDTAELVLLGVLAAPLGQYFSAIQFEDAGYLPKYPKRAQVTRAKNLAMELRTFLRDYSALMVEDKINWQATFSIDALISDLARVEREHKRPTDPRKAFQTMTVDRLIVETAKAFGQPSPALLVDLAAIIEYPIDGPNMSKRIREAMRGCSEPA